MGRPNPKSLVPLQRYPTFCWVSPIPFHFYSQIILPCALQPQAIPGQMHNSHQTPSASLSIPPTSIQQPISTQYTIPMATYTIKQRCRVQLECVLIASPSCWQHYAAKHEKEHKKARWPLLPSLFPLMSSSSREKKAGWISGCDIAQGR